MYAQRRTGRPDTRTGQRRHMIYNNHYIIVYMLVSLHVWHAPSKIASKWQAFLAKLTLHVLAILEIYPLPESASLPSLACRELFIDTLQGIFVECQIKYTCRKKIHLGVKKT